MEPGPILPPPTAARGIFGVPLAMATHGSHRQIWTWLEAHPVGQLFHAPYDVVFSDFDVVEPDLLYLSNERATQVLTPLHAKGVPELVVEFVSKVIARGGRCVQDGAANGPRSAARSPLPGLTLRYTPLNARRRRGTGHLEYAPLPRLQRHRSCGSRNRSGNLSRTVRHGETGSRLRTPAPPSVFRFRDLRTNGRIIGLTLLSKRIGTTTQMLFDAVEGDVVSCLGPLGRPFSTVNPGAKPGWWPAASAWRRLQRSLKCCSREQAHALLRCTKRPRSLLPRLVPRPRRAAGARHRRRQRRRPRAYHSAARA